MTNCLYVYVSCFVICILIVRLAALPPYIPYYYLYQGEKGQCLHHFRDDNLSLQCFKHVPILEAIPFLNTSVAVIGISVYQCALTMPYQQVFDTLNISTAGLDAIDIAFNENEPIPPGDYMKGLKITNLVMHKQAGSYTDIFKETRDFLEPLANVTSLSAYGVNIPPLPDSMRLGKLSLGQEASIQEWGNCKYIEDLSFSGLSTNSLPQWPQRCTNLVNLTFDGTPAGVGVEQYLANMTATAPSLINLIIKDSFLYTLPHDLLKNAERLEYLNLDDNNLYDKAFINFPLMKNLKVLDLSHNLIGGTCLKHLVPKVPSLKKLTIAYSRNVYRYCDGEFREGMDHLVSSSIEDLSFFDTEIDLSCFTHSHYANLTSLSLGGVITLQFRLMDLPTTDADNLTIDFYYKDFIDIYFNETDYKVLAERKRSGVKVNKLIIKVRYISCDCKHGWIARALRDFPEQLSMPGLLCDSDEGVPILEKDKHLIECDGWGREGCWFRREWGLKEVDADCNKGILPSKKHIVRGLKLSGLDLTTFYYEIPESVKWLDYRNNLISRADAHDVENLFKNGRRVWLGNNQFICDCDNRLLIDAIQQYKEQVQDYGELKCIGTGEFISSVDTAILCNTSLKIFLTALGVVAVFAMIMAVVIRRYREEIRMYLFTRGWFLMCLRKEDLEDKPFDAFISYAHGDEIYVRETLIPGLEKAVEQYKICVHYRDWLVGDWIPAQIMRSVKLSKRTIIVLSKNFIASSWSALEFRYAIANANGDNMSRVLILVLDDVLNVKLDPELEGYLSFNTYLDCNDPWFWEKLRYAMPHRSKKKSKETQQSDNCTTLDNNINSMIAMLENNSPLNNANSCIVSEF